MERGSVAEREGLAQHVQAFTRWKQDVVKELTRYRQWLNANGLNTSDLDARLNQALRTLKLDRILLAFVGEFSRGKSEMINALLCRHYGQRLLPTRIGRTTMCPTELYYDANVSGAYIKLLPIQTRNDGIRLSEYKQQLEHWVHLTINLDDSASMKIAFQEVAKTIQVTKQEATDLGFQVEFLESSQDNAGKVHVPAWRHALINIDHPLLRQGLSIIDTPGLNALGSEPELTLSLLPEAHAILLVLSADTGLTATDHMIWKDHVRDIVERRGAALYGVLNKIDMLWDEDEDEKEVQLHIQRLVQLTAKQLNLDTDHVLPLSARMAVKARLLADEDMLARSQLVPLEQVLAQSVVTTKQKIFQQTIVKDLLSMVEGSRKALDERQQILQADSQQLASPDRHSEHERVVLTRTVQQEQQIYNRRLAVLHAARKLMETQLPKLRAVATSQLLNEHMKTAQQTASSGVLGSGLTLAVGQYFAALRADITRLKDEVDYMDGTVQKLYQRYAQEAQVAVLDFPHLAVSEGLFELTQLEQQAMPFRSRLGNMVGAQKASDKFFSTIASVAGEVYLQMAAKAEQWCKASLGPLMQQTMQHRSRVQQLMEQLNRLTHQGSSRDQQVHVVEEKMAEMDKQVLILDSIKQNLSQGESASKALVEPA